MSKKIEVWTIHDNGAVNQTVISNSTEDRAIAFIPNLHPQSKEYVSLISAAPELLNALRGTLALISSTFKNEGWDCEEYSEVIKGREAVKKALGL